jgi:hypothetical protein
MLRRGCVGGLPLPLLATLFAPFFIRPTIIVPNASVSIAVRRPDSSVFIAIMTDPGRENVATIQWENGLASVASLPSVTIRYFGIGHLEDPGCFVAAMYVDASPFKFRGDNSRDFLYPKIKAAIATFLQTDCEWFVRLCDDTAVNGGSFPDFLAEVSRNRASRSMRLIQGHMIVKPWLAFPYPQGGAGVVLSRFAAAEILAKFDRFPVPGCRVCNDDRAFGLWMDNTNIPRSERSNRWFVGHSFRLRRGLISPFEIVQKQSVFEQCPDRPPNNSGLARYFQRLKDVTFWHAREDFLKFGPAVNQLRESFPDNLFFYSLGTNPVLCISTENTSLGYFG